MSYTLYDNKYLARNYFADRVWSVGYWPGRLPLAPEIQETYTLWHPPSRILAEFLINSQSDYNYQNENGFYQEDFWHPNFWNDLFWQNGESVEFETWDIYCSAIPDEPDEVISIFDTSPVLERRVSSQPYRRYYGLMILVRANDAVTGRTKMNEIFENLRMIDRDEVDVEYYSYRIDRVVFPNGINHLGCEPGTKQRHVFSLNVLSTVLGLEFVA